MKRIAALLLLAGLLAGCSMRTHYTVRLDLKSFLGETAENEVDLGTPTVFAYLLPDDDDGDLGTPDLNGGEFEAPLDGEKLESVRARLVVRVENRGSSTLRAQAKLYVAPPDETNLYDGVGNEVKLGETDLELGPGKSGALTLTVELGEGDPGFAVLTGGRFRAGLEISGTAQKFYYRVEALELELTSRRLGELLR